MAERSEQAHLLRYTLGISLGLSWLLLVENYSFLASTARELFFLKNIWARKLYPSHGGLSLAVQIPWGGDSSAFFPPEEATALACRCL